MKKTFKTIIALCLTIAMLSSLFAGVTFAAETVAVEWYGFDAVTASASLAEGTFASPSPVFFPANATETDVTWSVSDETKATVDENGVVTLLAAGTVTVTAKLVDGSAVVDSAVKKNGASYELTIDGSLLKANPSEVKFASANKGKEVVIIGAQGPLEIVSTSNGIVAEAVVLDETTIQVNSLAFGYAEITVTDGTNSLVVPVFVLPADMSAAQDTWKQIFTDEETAKTADPGYLQWYLEAITIRKDSGFKGAGILGYGQPMLNEDQIVRANAKNTSLDGQNKTYFRYIGDGYNYYNMQTGKGMTVQDMYQMLTIRVPKDGTVNIKPKTLSMSTSSTSDGSYIAIFKKDADGKMWRVFPAESADDEGLTSTDYYARVNVTRNWLWVYPSATRFGTFKEGDVYQNWNSATQSASTVMGPDNEPYTLTAEHIAAKKDFIDNGATFEVKAGETIRVVQHCGQEGNSDGMSFVPVFSYVESNVEGVLESETNVEIIKGETTEIRARLNPIGTEADITVEPAYANGTVVDVADYTYVPYSESNVEEYGYVDITLSASAESKAATGYYRMNYGNYTQLVAVTVAASADGSGDTGEEEEEAGVEVVLGQGSGSEGSEGGEGEGSGSEGGEGSGDGDDTPAFEFTFNATPSGLTVSEPSTPNAFNGKFTWKYTNSSSSAQDYFLLMLYGTRDGSDIDLSSLPTVGLKETSANANVAEFSDSYKGDFTPNSSSFPKNGGTADLFWFYGDYDNLAKNGMYIIGQYLNFTR